MLAIKKRLVNVPCYRFAQHGDPGFRIVSVYVLGENGRRTEPRGASSKLGDALWPRGRACTVELTLPFSCFFHAPHTALCHPHSTRSPTGCFGGTALTVAS